MRNTLEKQNTLVDFIEALATYYDLRGCKPSSMIYSILTTQLTKAIDIKDRSIIQAAQKCICLFDYLMTFAKYYDSINDILPLDHKIKFMDKITAIMTLTSCKKIK